MTDPVSDGSPAKKQPCGPDLRGKLTRAQVAHRLEVSVSKVRTMEGTTLHPEIIGGIHYFAAADVDAVACSLPTSNRRHPERDEGQIAARVFRLIDKGKELREIVEELEVPPQLARTLYREWKTDFEDGEQQRRRTAEEAVEERRTRQFDRDAERQSRDLERIMRDALRG